MRLTIELPEGFSTPVVNADKVVLLVNLDASILEKGTSGIAVRFLGSDGHGRDPGWWSQATQPPSG